MPIRDALIRRLPAEIRRGFELYDHSVSRMLGLWLDRRPWQRARNRLRAEADRLRQAGQHEAAIGAYRAYLSARPDHALAWCMLGYCLRVSARRTEAAVAYLRAAALAPRDPFILATTARFRQEDGEAAAAAALLEQALAAGGGHRLRNALTLLRDPGGRPAADAAPGDATLFIDVTDALLFLMHSRAVSGIQRVVTALMARALANPETICCVLTRPWDGRLWALPRAPQGRLLAMAAAAGCGAAAASALIGEIFDTAQEVTPPAGTTLFRAGGFWADGGNPPLHAALRRAGMCNALLIHDIIPLRHPQFCLPDLTRDFTAALAEEMVVVDRLLTVSRDTADDVTALFAERGMAAPTILPVPLAREASLPPGAWSSRLSALRGRRFVLTVGTVESRKNQALLVRIWARLIDPPLLVIAGKRGWLIGAFDEAMRQTLATGRILHLENLSDQEIATLYGACLFTTFPSLAEGWGLPVGESLAYGKLCVAARRSALVEAGGDFALYFDPEDEAGALALFARLIDDDVWRGSLEDRLRAGFRPRPWGQVATEMVAGLRAPPVSEPRPWEGPELAAGTVWRPSSMVPAPGLGNDPFPPPLRLMLAEGWSRPTSRGVAPSGASAPLIFRCPVPGRLALRFADGADRPTEYVARLEAGAHRLEVAPPPGTRLIELEFTALSPSEGGVSRLPHIVAAGMN